MRFDKFEKIVKTHCPKVEKVTQKSLTQDGAVMVVYKGSSRGYLYKGTYFEILAKLGVEYICSSAIDLYKKEIEKQNLIIEGKASYSLFDRGNEKERAKQRIEDIYKEIASYKGCLLIDETGEMLGLFTGTI